VTTLFKENNSLHALAADGQNLDALGCAATQFTENRSARALAPDKHPRAIPTQPEKNKPSTSTNPLQIPPHLYLGGCAAGAARALAEKTD
jgi:hypothetical protein